jgi:RND superfamily putative drug exporter
VFLRSFALTVVIVASGLFTTVAALGVLAMYDRWLGAGDGIAFFVPISAFVLLVSIGLDYGVLTGSTMRRVHASGARGLDAGRATIAEAYPSVVLAGIVIAGTFAVLATVELDSFRQIAVVLCAGVLIDSFVVRPLVVPLLMGLLPSRERHAAPIAGR